MDSPTPSASQAAWARGLISRRTAVAGMAGVSAAAALAACGSAGKNATSGATKGRVTAATDRSATDKLVNWSNWQSYIDVNEKTKDHPTLEAFTKKTGIKVKYAEDIIDNDEFYAKVRPLLAAGSDTGRDLWAVTDWMAARMIRLGYIQKLDLANIPNHGNVEDALLNVSWDKGRLYSLPWVSGMTGVAWNPKSTGGKKVESIDQLLTDPSLKGKVTLLTEMQDSVGMVLIALGKDPANFTDADFDAACAEIQQAKDAGQIKGFTGNDYTKALASGDTAACMAWSGDIVQLRADSPSLGYSLPQKGFMIWSDNLMIPNLAKHKKNAETLINYYYDPAVMAEVIAYVNYVASVKGTKAAMVKTDPEIATNQLILPPPDLLSRSRVFRGLTAAEESKYSRKFQAIVTG